MKAYQFWYISCPNGRTQYIWIIAEDYREAIYFYKKYGYTKMYDFETIPVWTKPYAKWQQEHQRGDLLGEDAII